VQNTSGHSGAGTRSFDVLAEMIRDVVKEVMKDAKVKEERPV
jgi:hypothetical protein